MIVRHLDELINTPRDVCWGNGQSRRLLLAQEGMGFSLTDTLVAAGSESLLQYRNHLEACYCIEGRGEVEEMDGTKHIIAPGTVYALNQHEAHYLRAHTNLRLICVFLPPLQGHEHHILNPGGSSSY